MKKVYYFPTYCYHHWPSLIDGLKDIISALGQGQKLTVYASEEVARKHGQSMLSDDDAYGIIKLDFTHGYCDISYGTESTILCYGFNKNNLDIRSK